jgi:hypothetical protein
MRAKQLHRKSQAATSSSSQSLSSLRPPFVLMSEKVHKRIFIAVGTLLYLLVSSNLGASISAASDRSLDNLSDGCRVRDLCARYEGFDSLQCLLLRKVKGSC